MLSYCNFSSLRQNYSLEAFWLLHSRTREYVCLANKSLDFFIFGIPFNSQVAITVI
ncbi:hypothetical protein ACE6H2_028527 [Prunus campanulata]